MVEPRQSSPGSECTLLGDPDDGPEAIQQPPTLFLSIRWGDLPHFSHYESLFEDISNRKYVGRRSLPPFEKIVWKDLPDPSRFEVAGHNAVETEIVENQVQEPEYTTDHLPLRDYELKVVENPDEPLILSLLPKGDSDIKLAWCTVTTHTAVFRFTGSTRMTTSSSGVITDMKCGMARYHEIFLAKIAEELDKRQIMMTLMYTTHLEDIIMKSSWKRQSIKQLRIRLKLEKRSFPSGTTSPSGFYIWNTAKFLPPQLDKFIMEEYKIWYEKETALGDKLETHDIFVIDPIRGVYAQQKKFYPDAFNSENEGIQFRKYCRQGVSSAQNNGETTTWVSWVEDDQNDTLRVNRIVASRNRGLTMDFLCILRQCADQAQAVGYENMVIWDPPEEMYDAAVALADQLHHGSIFEVFREEVDDCQIYTRWHPKVKRAREDVRWMQRQFYCCAGTIEGGF